MTSQAKRAKDFFISLGIDRKGVSVTTPTNKYGEYTNINICLNGEASMSTVVEKVDQVLAAGYDVLLVTFDDDFIYPIVSDNNREKGRLASLKK